MLFCKRCGRECNSTTDASCDCGLPVAQTIGGVTPAPCEQGPVCPALHQALHDINDKLTQLNQRVRHLERCESKRQRAEARAEERNAAILKEVNESLARLEKVKPRG